MDPQYENLIAEGQQGRTDEHAEDTGGRQTSQGSKKDHDPSRIIAQIINDRNGESGGTAWPERGPGRFE